MASVPQDLFAATVSAADLTALQQTVAHFDREQLIWSSGFLAGMAGSTAPCAAVGRLQPITATAAENWHIFYATETGHSRKIAEQLAANARAAGVATDLHDLKNTRPKTLKGATRAVFVLATHGIGEAPEGSEAFFEFWMSDKAPQLPQLNYSVLALGDSSYADFCAQGRVFDDRLQTLGARPLFDRVECDLDFETAATGWAEQIIARARDESGTAEVRRPALLRAVPSAQTTGWQEPFAAEILARQRITGRGSSKNVQHIELDLEGSGLVYQPGDSLAVQAANPLPLIDALADATGIDGAEFSTKEITALSRPLLDAVAQEHAPLRAVLDDRAQFADYLATRQLIDLVHEYPVDWQQPQFLAALRKLAPRSYSIASSPDANPDEAHLTVAVVDYEAHGRRHWGAASNFLAGAATHAPVLVEANENFRLPPDGDTPIIMVGAGTGVAPYRAFVEHRREHGHHGDNWLVFGDRNLSSDFLYQLEWLRYRKEGLLTNLDVAFSRDQGEKMYVQHRLLEKSAQIFAWLQRGAHFYVCGDANHMAGDVHEALLAIVRQEGKLSDDNAAAYVRDLKQVRRYQRDVY
ncbi:MAG: flavodoxin domain-containing protein [Proteobacteria bacterium]|nr:flavodoxin domain-containing protein [Pseudomonadota bacterium]